MLETKPRIIKWRKRGSTTKHAYYIGVPVRKQTKQSPTKSQCKPNPSLSRKVIHRIKYGWKKVC